MPVSAEFRWAPLAFYATDVLLEGIAENYVVRPDAKVGIATDQ